jgi:hypothetical protein
MEVCCDVSPSARAYGRELGDSGGRGERRSRRKIRYEGKQKKTVEGKGIREEWKRERRKKSRECHSEREENKTGNEGRRR